MNKEENPKWRSVVSIIATFMLVVIATLYYYRLHLNFLPDPEYHCLLWIHYIRENFNVINNWTFSDIFTYIPYKIFGMSVLGIRIFAVSMYFIVMFFTIILALYSNLGKAFRVNWFILPVFIFLAVILNPSDATWLRENGTFCVYPYDAHIYAVVFSLLEIFLIELYTNWKSSKAILIGIVVIGIVGVKVTDLIFLVGFWAPIICYFTTKLWLKNRKYVINGLIGILGIIAILRFLSIFFEPFRHLFELKTLGYADWINGGVYGNIGFVDPENIWKNISVTAKEIMALFNIDIVGRGIISINTIICLIRSILLVLIFAFAILNIVNSFRANKRTDLVNVLISYGIILNVLVVIISKYGSDASCVRYISLLVPYGVILLCRELENLLQKYDADKYYKKAVFICFSLCIVINMVPLWRTKSNITNYEEAAKYIEENQLGNGIGGWRYGWNLTALMDGEYAVISASATDDAWEIPEMDIHLNYIIDGEGDNHFFEIDDIEQKFGKPDQVLTVASFTIYFYENGLGR